jgi:hypothetical protein
VLALIAVMAPVWEARAEPLFPGPGAAGETALLGVIDTPGSGQAVSPSAGFTVSGWVVDQTAEGWSGVNQVEIYDGRVETGGTLLASGPADLPRQDVADALHYPYWASSGFNLYVPGDRISWGPRTLAVYAVTPDKGRWLMTVPIFGQALSPSPNDAFPTDPLIRVFQPLPFAILRTSPDIIRGIALDRNVSSARGVPGVDRVDIYAGAPRESGGIFVARAESGKKYGDMGFELQDPRFQTSGFDAIWSPTSFRLGGADMQLYIYAHRQGTDVWNVARVPVTVAP